MTNTPRICNYPRTDGRLCKSPSISDKRFCFYHQRDYDRRPRLESNLDHRRSCIARQNFYELHTTLPDGRAYDDNVAGLFSDLQPPLLDDGNAIAQELSSVYFALSTQQIPVKQGYAMLHTLYLASSNLKHVHTPDFDYDRRATVDENPIHRMPGFETVAEIAQERANAMAAELKAKKEAAGTKE